ncbi:MAG: hypothetical protein VKL00_00975 [Synechococcales bacterium]|nr:hypothetical protein [Synechococcales bacterium]
MGRSQLGETSSGNKTSVMAIGLYHRRISMLELLSLRGFSALTP